MSSTPRFGLFLPSAVFTGRSAAQALDATVATAVAAEAAGFDDVWLAEHHFQSYGACPSALTLAGYVLGATRRITVATAVTVLTHQHPVAVAEQALLLDQVSGGGCGLGVGRGGPWVDLRVFDVVEGRFEHGFADALDTLLRTLRGGEILPGVGVVPPPTGASPGVAVAATSTSTVDLAAARGLPLLLGMHADDGEKAAALRRHGRTAAHVGVGVAHIADTDAAAEDEVRAHLPRWLGPGLASYRRADGRPHRTRDPHAYTEHLIGFHPVGSAERCRVRIAETLRTTGLRRLAFLVDTTGDPARTARNVRDLAAVLAPLRGTSASARRDGRAFQA
jgi:alkanesulfonate monooxygenase SsuD/methylene tetrahydromethanopterin reductase-like flavin-dependent oxidoreductase (luciferase family)